MKPLPAGLVVFLLCACEKAAPDKPLQYSSRPAAQTVAIYRLAVHPLHNPQKLSEAYQPLVDYLNGRITGARLELEASRDYQSYERKLRARAPAILLPNPWQTMQAMKVGYQVVAMAGDAADFKGLIIVRKDSGIKAPADLKGKVVSYPSRTALAGCIMPQYYLHRHGVDINHDVENIYVGSQESSIMSVFLKNSAAGATWPPPWRLFLRDQPEKAAQLEVVWETPPLINNSVMVRDDVPAATREQFVKALLELSGTQQGKAILSGMETSRFLAADDASYAVVADYIARFEQEVRPVEAK